MSDILNHYYCGRKVMNVLSKNVKDLISKYVKLYDLGTQGPDFFFYDGALPWLKSTGMQKYGSRLHKDPVNRLFASMIKTGMEAEDERMMAYIYGFICHHALDVTTHPYINYIAGIYDEEDPNTYQYRHCHKKVEVILDILHSQYMGETQAVRTRYWDIFNINEDDRQVLYKLYGKLVKELYNEDITKDSLDKCFSDACRTNKVTCDKTGMKRIIFGAAEKIVSKEPYMFTKAVYTKDVKEKRDFLNNERMKWHDPCDYDVIRDSTYPEMFDDACNQATDRICKIAAMDAADIKAEAIDAVFGNLSFETGRPYDEYDILQYSNCILI